MKRWLIFCLLFLIPSISNADSVIIGLPSNYSLIKDEGTSLTVRTILNFIGADVTCVDNTIDKRTDCTISAGGGGYATIKEENTALTQRTTLAFESVDMTCADDGVETETECVLPDLEEEVTTGSLADGVINEPDLDVDNTPGDGDILTYDSTGTNFNWIVPNAGTDVTADLEEEAHCAEHDSGDLDCSGETLIYAADSIDFTEILQDNTLAGNPALLVDECYFAKTVSGGGFICEGSTADANEQLYLFPDVNGADTTVEITALGQSISDTELESNYSGVGACGANTAATTLNDNAAPTCSEFTALGQDIALGTETSNNYVDDVLAGIGIAVTHTPGEGSDATVAFKFTDTLAGNPTFNAGEGVFTDDCIGGGFLFEGSTGGNTNEYLLCSPLADPVDTTNYFALGASDGDALAGDSATSFFDTGTIEDARLSTLVSLLGSSISFISPAEIADECAGNESIRRNAGDTAWECYTAVAGSGDNITVNTTAAVDANFLDNIYIDWALDGAATPDDITAKPNYAETQAGNPALLAEECIFTVDGTGGGGILCEGTTADINEGLIQWNPTTDKILTLPDATDTIVGRDTTDTLTLKTILASNNVVEADDLICTDCINDTEVSTNAGTALSADLEEEVTEGSLADSTIISADIKDDVIDWTDILYTNTLAGNPAFATDECYFMSTATGGCFICEGSTANTNEQAYCFPDVDGVDTTDTIALLSNKLSAFAATTSAELAGVISDETGSGKLTFATDPVFLTSMAIPVDGTVDANGEATQDTTDGQLKVYSTSVRVHDPRRSQCTAVANVADTTDNMPFGSFPFSVTVTGVWCHYAGSAPTTAATFTLEDGNGNAMTITGTNPTCGAPTANAAIAAVTAANGLVAGELLRFDTTNTPNPATDTYQICVSYTVDAT